MYYLYETLPLGGSGSEQNGFSLALLVGAVAGCQVEHGRTSSKTRADAIAFPIILSTHFLPDWRGALGGSAGQLQLVTRNAQRFRMFPCGCWETKTWRW